MNYILIINGGTNSGPVISTGGPHQHSATCYKWYDWAGEQRWL